MKLYNTAGGIFLVDNEQTWLVNTDWDSLINRDGLEEHLKASLNNFVKVSAEVLQKAQILAPINSQEIWAAGVTWLRSRDARMEESETAASLYDLVYNAERPELFFKATKQRVAAHLQEVYIRKDSTWDVPEPELTLFISSAGNIQGYTIGNDMSSRSIEGENALYLPQAKIYERCAGLGPCLYVTSTPLSAETTISMNIKRAGEVLYNDSVQIARIKRSFTELAGFLFRECDFPSGCFLMTGTCLVPSNDFTLQPGDVVEMSIEGIGTLINTVAYHPKHG